MHVVQLKEWWNKWGKWIKIFWYLASSFAYVALLLHLFRSVKLESNVRKTIFEKKREKTKN